MYMLYRFIFYLYVYSVDFHHCTESIFKSSFTSTSSNLAILTRLAKSGCEELVHHFETVEGLIFNCSDSHLLVLFFSTNTIFSLLISFISTFSLRFPKDSEEFSLLYLHQMTFFLLFMIHVGLHWFSSDIKHHQIQYNEILNLQLRYYLLKLFTQMTVLLISFCSPFKPDIILIHNILSHSVP